MKLASGQKKNKRPALRMFCLILVLTIVLSAVFVTVEADHECDGDECVVCAVIRRCETVLKEIGLICVLIRTAWMRTAALTASVTGLLFLFRVAGSPVTEKVRMDN